MSKRRRGMSLEEKRDTLMSIFHTTVCIRLGRGFLPVLARVPVQCGACLTCYVCENDTLIPERTIYIERD